VFDSKVSTSFASWTRPEEEGVNARERHARAAAKAPAAASIEAVEHRTALALPALNANLASTPRV